MLKIVTPVCWTVPEPGPGHSLLSLVSTTLQHTDTHSWHPRTLKTQKLKFIKNIFSNMTDLMIEG